MKFESILTKTEKRHSDLVDSMAYAVATQMYKYRDDYVLLHIQNCPKWLPEFVYKWILSKVLVMDNFKK